MIEKVREFMERQNIPVNVDWSSDHPKDEAALLASQTYYATAATRIKGFAAAFEPHTDKCSKMLRCALLLEEVAEFCNACDEDEEILALDAITDLLYVVLGTAITYGWNLEGAFEEVHRSNMTKALVDHPRCREKGDDFEPPQLEQFIR